MKFLSDSGGVQSGSESEGRGEASQLLLSVAKIATRGRIRDCRQNSPSRNQYPVIVMLSKNGKRTRNKVSSSLIPSVSSVAFPRLTSPVDRMGNYCGAEVIEERGCHGLHMRL
jgi:hypothetical protein